MRWTGLVLAGALALVGCQADQTTTSSFAAAPSATPEARHQPDEVPAAVATRPAAVPLAVRAVPTQRSTPSRSALLFAAPGGDGDSWHDTNGVEYRLGLINTPEHNECFGSQATAERARLVNAGFRAKVYAHDHYGRAVSVVTLADGTNLNVYLARHGYANDRYLSEFRHENPALATQLDTAFAAAKRAQAGLWRACAAPARAPQAAVQQRSNCHPDYVTCIPIKGDGSGQGDANDLDCPDIGQRVTLRSAGVDPYRLDADGDGIGCNSY